MPEASSSTNSPQPRQEAAAEEQPAAATGAAPHQQQQQSSLGSSSSTSSHAMKPQQQQQQRRRLASSSSRSSSSKRRRGAGAASSAASMSSSHSQQQQQQHGSSGSSDSGSSEDEDDASSQIQQPEGWRVKLYRLNQDGSWDDCGTGRILCLHNNYSNSSDGNSNSNNNNPKQQADKSEKFEENSDTNNADNDRDNNGSSLNQQQQQQQPHEASSGATLCVRAEVHKGSYHNHHSHNSSSNNNNNSSGRQSPRVLLRTRILLTDAYQRQGDNIITWCEPCYYNSNSSSDPDNPNSGSSGATAETGVDLALSFQDNAGCLDIWRQITHVQGRAAAKLGDNVEDLAAQAAAQHHADIQQRLQNWDYQSAAQQQQMDGNNNRNNNHNGNGGDYGNNSNNNDGIIGPQQQAMLEQLPSPPTLQNLEDIADTIAALQHVQQRESLAAWIAGDRDDECLYLKQLLALFPEAEERGDYGKLATLAACVKTILLLNDPSILELIVNVASIFEQVCSCLEYDPDLREKANHRWFLRERAKFRTVVPMEDPDLVDAIHRSFRVNYLRDTLLRPTMDESSLSTLTSLQTFTHADVIKGVTMSSGQDESLRDSYLVRVIRLLGVELHALGAIDWAELESAAPVPSSAYTSAAEHNSDHYHHHRLGMTTMTTPDPIQPDPSIVVGQHNSMGASTWKQYLAPQDYSVTARRMRRRGCLSFLRELFNMVRVSLQQGDKDDFFSVLCTLEIDLNEDREIPDNVSQTSQNVEVGSVASTVRSERLDEKMEEKHFETNLPSTFLLSLLGTVLSDPSTDTTEKGAVLEILAGVAMHDPSLIRRHCLECHQRWKKDHPTTSTAVDSVERNDVVSYRPKANESKQVIYLTPPNDLLSSLLFLFDVETDAGILLQVSEIMRIILDTDVMVDHGPMSPGFADEAEGILPGNSGHNPPHDQHNQPSGSGATSTDQKRFLSIFYEHYVEWLVAPFMFTILQPSRRIPDTVLVAPSESVLLQRILKAFEKGIGPSDPYLRTVPVCAIRTSFAVELLSFCVRAHLYRMKFFLLKSGVLGNVLKLLRPHPDGVRGIVSGDRCLKLAALRFLRAILSVNDEFYHRHIIQHDLFAPVFEAFRANPVGDNLVSSAIVEMCDYIHSENIKSLLEYIVTKFLTTATDCPGSANSNNNSRSNGPSLEDVSSPYVSTLTTLRKAYEANIQAAQQRKEDNEKGQSSPGGSRYFPGGLHHSPRQLSGKALEEQRKFLEVDNDESYFDMDDDDDDDLIGPVPPPPSPPPVVDEVDAQEKESEMHRTPRMFSLAQAPLLNSLECGESNNNSKEPRDQQLPPQKDGDRPLFSEEDNNNEDLTQKQDFEAMEEDD